MASPLVELQGLTKAYGRTVAVDGVDLAIEAGAFVVLLGPSGSGKTTILSMLGGFVEPSAGRVLIAGDDVTTLPPARRPTATVFQDYALFPHMSVTGNVAFGLAMRRIPGPERRARAEAMLEMVGLGGFGRRGVHELSGGQRQRVALARAIAVEPKLLLLDEPLGALDLALRRQMQEELVRLQRELGTTFVHVTHDQEEAMSIADLVVVMNRGRIEDMGPPDRVYLRPATLFTATFMGESNILDGRVAAAADGLALVETELGTVRVTSRAGAGDRLHLSIRPEHLHIGAPKDDTARLGHARIAGVTFQGTHLRVHARAETGQGRDLLMRVPIGVVPVDGARVPLSVDPADVVALSR